MAKTTGASRRSTGIAKALTGSRGCDEITGGGLPRGRPTLVCGAAGCGKTLLGDGVPRPRREGATSEPGVFIAFEETAEELTDERALARLRSRRAGRSRSSCSSTTSHDRARARSRRPASTTSRGCSSGSGYAIDSIGAKRVVLDTIETLFGGFTNRGDPARRAAAPVPLAEGHRASPPSSPPSAATARSPATGSRSTSRTA